jgi:hypothetical protein
VEGLKNCKDFHVGKNKYFLTEFSKIILSKILLAVGFEPAYFSENILQRFLLTVCSVHNYLFFA